MSRSFIKELLSSADSELAAQQAHALAKKQGLEVSPYLATLFITAYSRLNRPVAAEKTLRDLPTKTVPAWTAAAAAFLRAGHPTATLRLIRQMITSKLPPDSISVTTAAAACARLGALRLGSSLHAFSIRRSTPSDLFLTNSLIDLYAKCGAIDKARALFDRCPSRDAATWTALIFGCAVNGRAGEALALFGEMTWPNPVTFLAALMACSHAGRVDEALRLLQRMRSEHRLEPRAAHYGCVVDALCRAGDARAAAEVAAGSPSTAVVWRMLMRGEVGGARAARRRLRDLGAERGGDDVAMGNVYAAAGMWEEKEDARSGIRRRDHGRSVIEIDGRMHEFAGGDRRRHRRRKELLEILRRISLISSTSL
ncbi:putative pentatricopeptide repeat-containing protein At1g74400 [Wolffia australiana]